MRTGSQATRPPQHAGVLEVGRVLAWLSIGVTFLIVIDTAAPLYQPQGRHRQRRLALLFRSENRILCLPESVILLMTWRWRLYIPTHGAADT